MLLLAVRVGGKCRPGRGLQVTSLPFFLLGADLDLFGALGFLELGNDHAQDAVLEAGLHVLLVDRVGEGKASRKLADLALRDPVGVLGLGFGDLFRSSSGDLFTGGFLLLLTIGRLASLVWSLTFFSVVLGVALDGQGLVVLELDGDVLLVDARQFTLEDVLVLSLLDVELGGEGARG